MRLVEAKATFRAVSGSHPERAAFTRPAQALGDWSRPSRYPAGLEIPDIGTLDSRLWDCGTTGDGRELLHPLAFHR